MSDHYSEFVQNPLGRKIAQNLGLPIPVNLERYKEGQAPITGSVILESVKTLSWQMTSPKSWRMCKRMSI